MLKPVLPLAEVRAPALDLTLSDVVEGLLDVVARLFHTRLAAVARIESTTYTVMSVVDQHHTLRPGQIYQLHDTFCMHMLEQGQPLCISDITQAPMPFRFLPNRLELNIRSYIGVPLYMADGRVFGSLWAADPSVRLFSEQDVAMLQLFARLLRYELDQDAQTRHLERIEQVKSMHTSIDQLTGLLARDSFEAALAKEEQREPQPKLLCRFRTLDHAAGAAQRCRHHAALRNHAPGTGRYSDALVAAGRLLRAHRYRRVRGAVRRHHQ
jgi:GAF domain-containing protein